MRVNPNTTTDIISLLNQTQANQTNALQELSTGRRVSKPSDDPAAEAAMIAENSRLSANDQFTKSSDALKEVLSSADSTLSSVVSLMQRAITLGVEGANSGSLNQSNLNSIASELSGIKSQLVSLANTSYAGQYLFGGTATSTPPYSTDASGNVTYSGNSQQNQVQIGVGLSVAANLPGSSLFTQSGANVFDALQTMVTALQAGNTSGITAAVSQITTASNAVNTARVFYGNTVNELTSNETFLSQEKVNIASYQDTLVSSDTAQATTDVTQAEYARNATIAAAARMNQTSLLDYLK